MTLHTIPSWGVKHFFHLIDDLCEKAYSSPMLARRILRLIGINLPPSRLDKALSVAMCEACSQLAREMRQHFKR